MTNRAIGWFASGVIAAVIVASVTFVAYRKRTQQSHVAANTRAFAVEPVVNRPIAAEALVFRSRSDAFAGDQFAPRRNAAHPRTLATYRALRAYPGAPPRVPHGLTRDEYFKVGCRTCHDRGGYSQRFGAYAPVTPHPEQVMCLQCHLVDDRLVGIPLPQDDGNDRCRQCHDPSNPGAPEKNPRWSAAAWPSPAPRPRTSPPPIPHDLHMRGHCLTCHLGPGSVEEIRTTHPQNADCRACHLTMSPTREVFSRSTSVVDVAGGRR